MSTTTPASLQPPFPGEAVALYRGAERIWVRGGSTAPVEPEPPAQLTPLDVDTLVGYYDGLDSASLIDDGGSPSAWVDLSANGNDLSPGGVGAITTGSMSGGQRGAAMANRSAWTGLPALPAGWSALLVVELDDSDSTQSLLGEPSGTVIPFARGGRSDTEIARSQGTSYIPTIYTNGALSNASTRGEVYSEIVTGTPLVIYLEGNLAQSALGLGMTNRSYSFNGVWGAAAIFNAALTTQQRSQLESFFADRWAITLSTT